MTTLGDQDEALATLVGLDSITLAGQNLDVKITGLITGHTLTRSINAVPNFQLVFNDPDRAVARSGIFGQDVTCHVGPYQYSATSINKSGRFLTMGFQDNVVAQLEKINSPLNVVAGQMTHVDFVRLLLKPLKWLKFMTVDNPGKYKVQTSLTPLFRGNIAAKSSSQRVEGTWAAINRIGALRGWRTFIRGVDELWYVPDAYLFNDAVAYTMSEDESWVDDINYDLNIRKTIATCTLIVRAAEYAIPPGVPVLITDPGPTNGKWIVQDITRSPITHPQATVTLIKPTPILPEPVPNSTASSSGSSSGGGGGTAAISSNRAIAVAQYAIQVGFVGSGLLTAVEVSFAEDGSHDPTVFSRPNTDGSIDRGLWQINNRAHPNYSDNDMRNGLKNAQAAYSISSQGHDWTPWTTYKSGAYSRYQSQAVAAVAAAQRLNAQSSSSASSAAGATIGTGSGGRAPAQVKTKLAADFINEALSQRGKPYVFGSEPAPSNSNPSGLDCSSLVAWAAERVGITTNFPRNAEAQYEYCVQAGTNIPVSRGRYIRGAILFKAGSDPQGKYGIGHVAISMGNGTDTFEAYSSGYAINIFHGAADFTYAALVPGMRY